MVCQARSTRSDKVNVILEIKRLKLDEQLAHLLGDPAAPSEESVDDSIVQAQHNGFVLRQKCLLLSSDGAHSYLAGFQLNTWSVKPRVILRL